MKIAVMITGASGLPLAFRLIEVLLEKGFVPEIVLSSGAVNVAKTEPCKLNGKVPCNIVEELKALGLRPHISMMSKLASSSQAPDVGVVIPCSMKTLALIANGIGSTLPSRVALNILRSGKKLVLVPRETPIGPIELENMLKLAKLGVSIVIPTFAFYSRPKTLSDVIDFIVGKVLDQLGIDHKLYRRYGEV